MFEVRSVASQVFYVYGLSSLCLFEKIEKNQQLTSGIDNSAKMIQSGYQSINAPGKNTIYLLVLASQMFDLLFI